MFVIKSFFHHNDVGFPIALTLTLEIGNRTLTLNLGVLVFSSRNRFSSSLLRLVRIFNTNEFLGDFSARDHFPMELESNFGEKVIGNGGTELRILISNISALSLAKQQCSPISSLSHPCPKKIFKTSSEIYQFTAPQKDIQKIFNNALPFLQLTLIFLLVYIGCGLKTIEGG
ncbi:hypothetical protein PIB30_068106, partial [Stylosanthes scabra]|nr:hypothetical protein [Stylosanthes scabra]